jgi:hypothetical protein
MTLRNLFSAQSFPDWYTNLTNQLGHRWLGQFVGLSLLTVGHWLCSSPITPLAAMAIGVVGYIALWEVEDGPEWDWVDSLSDTAHMAGGITLPCLICAVLPVAAIWPVLTAWWSVELIIGSLLALETWRRWK